MTVHAWQLRRAIIHSDGICYRGIKQRLQYNRIEERKAGNRGHAPRLALISSQKSLQQCHAAVYACTIILRYSEWWIIIIMTSVHETQTQSWLWLCSNQPKHLSPPFKQGVFDWSVKAWDPSWDQTFKFYMCGPRCHRETDKKVDILLWVHLDAHARGFVNTLFAQRGKFEDLRLAWLILIKDSTWLWLSSHDLRLDKDLRQMT